MLARLRGFLPDARSLLMDKTTLDLYRMLAIADETRNPAFDTSLLQPNEMDVLSTLSAGRMRLEQERIPMDYVREEIERIMGSPMESSFESIRADVIHPVAVAIRDLFGNACGFREIPPFFDGFGNLPDDENRVLDSMFSGQFLERR